MKRRTFLTGAATATVGALAGCLGGDDEQPCPPANTTNETETPTLTPPDAEFGYEYSRANREVSITVQTQDEFNLDAIEFRAGGVDGESLPVVDDFTGESKSWSRGEEVIVGEVTTDTELAIVWLEPEEPAVVTTWTVPVPEAEFNTRYYPGSSEMDIVHRGGDGIDQEAVTFRGSNGGVEVYQWATNDGVMTNGERVTIGNVNDGETVTMYWESAHTGGQVAEFVAEE